MTVVCCHVIPCYLEKCTETSEKLVAFVVRVDTDINRVHQSILIATEVSATSVYTHQTSETHIHRDTFDVIRPSSLVYIQVARYRKHSFASPHVYN